MKRYAASSATAWFLMLSILAPGGAAAQTTPSPANVARARVLVDEGLKLTNAGQLKEACVKFKEAVDLVPNGVGAHLYLADCYRDTGRTASAWAEYKEAERLATATNNPRAAVAAARASAIDPAIPRLTITAQSPAPDLVVKRNGVIVPSSQLGVAALLDPGTYTISAAAPRRRSWQTAISLAPGQKSTVVVPSLMGSYTLTIRVPEVYPALTVRWNNASVSALDFSRPKDAEAGHHVVTAEAPGRLGFRRSVEIGASNPDAVVTVELEVQPGQAPKIEPTPMLQPNLDVPADQPAPKGNLGGAQKLGVVLLSLGGQALLGASVAGVVAGQEWGKALDQCTDDACYPGGTAPGLLADRWATAANGLLVGGALGAAIGIFCIALGPRAPAGGTGARPVSPPAVRLSAGGFALAGEF